MSNKIGFWSVFELVSISQIGSGLVLPASLAFYGKLTLIGWIISSMGAILLAVMFSELCVRYPRTGGPNVYVHEAFGSSAAFFTGWTYWVISWISTIAIVTSAVGYLTPFIGEQSSQVYFVLEALLMIVICVFNCKGVSTASRTKFIVIALKMIPLILVPVAALFFFDSNNFAKLEIEPEETSSVLNSVVILTFWGFIGFESATTAASEVSNPKRIIPPALIIGTIFVAIVYFISSLGIMGVIPSAELMNSEAPYADAARLVFGGYWYLFISLVAAIICIGAINSWTLASGQIALGITQDGLMPKFFAQTNKHGVPVVPLTISCIGSIFFLFLTQNESLTEKVNTIIDLSVVSFLFVYVLCCLAFLKIIWQEKKVIPLWQWLCGLVSLGFCLWIIVSTPMMTLLLSSLFVLSGLPVYFFRRKKLKRMIMNPVVTEAALAE